MNPPNKPGTQGGQVLSFQVGTNHLKDYFRILMARRWVLASVVVCVMSAVLVMVMMQKPVYTAHTQLLIDTNSRNITGFESTESPLNGELTRRAYIDTMVQLVTARPLLERTFRAFNFGERLAFRESPDPIPDFGNRIHANLVRNTSLVNLSFDWPDREESAQVLNYLTQEYIAETRKRRLGVTLESYEALQKKADELRPKVEAAFRTMHDFMVLHNMVSFDRSASIVADQLKDLTGQLADLRKERGRLESQFNSVSAILEASRSGGTIEVRATGDGATVSGGTSQVAVSLVEADLSSIPEVAESQIVRDLKLSYLQSKQALDDLSKTFGPQHNEVVTTKARLEAIAERMNQEILSILGGVEIKYRRMREEEAQMQKQLQDQEEAFIRFKDLEQKYNVYDTDYQTLKKTLETINRRLEEIEIVTAAGSKNDNIYIIEIAVPPVKPSKPNRKLSLAVALVLSFGIGGSLCFFLDYLDTTIKGRDDVSTLLGLPVLGYVPALSSRELVINDDDALKETMKPELVAVYRPRSSIAEAFRTVRTGILFSGTSAEIRHLLVSSASPQEGKTTTSVNTALALAQSGKRVLLIDADMRKPRLHRVFTLDNSFGLSNMLVGGEVPTQLDQYSCYKDLDTLYVLPCGPIPPNPAELLGNGRIPELLRIWDQIFDMVVFDTPPVINVTDAAVLSQYVHGAILVLRSFATQRELAMAARNTLVNAQARILGVVLNNVDVPKGGYYSYDNYYYYQSYYYYYGSGDQQARRMRRRRGARSGRKG